MYISPDTILPFATALAAIGGIAMMFWQRTVAIVRSAVRAVARLFSRH